jgi:hypothetical protein
MVLTRPRWFCAGFGILDASIAATFDWFRPFAIVDLTGCFGPALIMLLTVFPILRLGGKATLPFAMSIVFGEKITCKIRALKD